MRSKFLILGICIIFLLFINIFSANAVIIPISGCNAENYSLTAANFNRTCFNMSSLNVNDNRTENYSYGRSVPTVTQAGINITVQNTSVTNCGSITNVNICYEWWAVATPVATTCYVSVSNGSNSFVNITTTCPGTTANPATICTNVTANRTWICGNFFGTSGTRAQARSEVSGPASGGSSTGLANWDQLYFNVNYTTLLSAPSNQTVELGNYTTLQWNMSGTNGSYWIYRNGTLVSGPSLWSNNVPIVIVPNTYVLGVWNYTLIFNQTGSSGNTSSTTFLTVVDNNYPSCSEVASGTGQAGLATQANITINGNMNDWAGVLLNPSNVIGDTTKLTGDGDPLQTSDRDMMKFAYTYNSQYLYFYFMRNIVGSRQVSMLVYVDYNLDGYMNSTDKVLKFTWSGSNGQYSSSIHDYIPFISSGDQIFGNAYSMPGSISSGTSLESGVSGGSITGTELEVRVLWSSLGLPGPTALNFKGADALGAGTNLPSQIEDNIGNMLPASSSYLYFQASQSKPGTNGTSIYYTADIMNCGNKLETISFTNISSQGWNVSLYYPNGTMINGSMILTANSYTAIIIRIDAPSSATTGTTDLTRVNVTSSSMNTSLTFTTTIVNIGISPKTNLKYGTQGMIVNYDYTIYNYQTTNDTIDVNITSNNSWTLSLRYSNGTSLTDTNADGRLDVGNVLAGDSKNIIISVTIPGAASVGTIDILNVRINSSATPSRSDTATANTTVRARLTLVNNYTNTVGVGQTYYYQLNITDNWNQTEPIEVYRISNLGWTTNFYRNDLVTLLTDTNSNSLVDINMTGYGDFKTIYAGIFIPTNATIGQSEITNVYANSSLNTSISSMIRINQTVRGIAVYNDSGFLNLQNLFNIGLAGNTTVYAKADYLNGFSSVFFIWYSGNGSVYKQSSNITVSSGIANDSINLNINSGLGSWTVGVYNAVNNSEIARASFTTRDSINPQVYGPGPIANSTAAINSTIEISVNVSDYGPIYIVIANISCNGSSQLLTLTNPVGDYYNGFFTVPNTTGQCNITFFANDTFGYSNNSITTYFNVVSSDSAKPTINIDYPANNSLHISPTVDLQCSATDNVALSRIDFYRGGILRQSNTVSGNSSSTIYTISGLVNGTYNWSCISYDASGNFNQSATYYFTINTSLAPIYTNYSGNTTNWSNVPDITNVCNGTAIIDNPPTDKVQWHDCVNAAGVNFDVNVNLSYNFVDVIFGLHNTFNSSATITMRNLSYESEPNILRDGILCDNTSCTNRSYDNNTGILIFDVPHFTNYTTSGSSALRIWDQNDSNISYGNQTACANDLIKFYANYTKSGSQTSGATCTINFIDSSGNAMLENATTAYNYIYNRTFSSLGIKNYNVTCSKSGSATITLSDSINITDCNAPSVTLNNPPADYINNTGGPVNLTFNCSATDNIGLKNISLYITNSTNQSFAFNRTTNITGTSNSTAWNLTLINGDYTWNCIAYDNSSNFNWSTNRTITITAFAEVIGFTITLPGQSPVNASITNETGLMFINSSTGDDQNVTPCVYGSTNCQNSTLPFFQLQNTGNVNLTWSVSLDSNLPNVFELIGKTDNSPTGARIINTSIWNISINIAPLSLQDAWFWGNFYNADIENSTNRTLTHNGTKT